MVGKAGFEPAANSLKGYCSTTELLPRGALFFFFPSKIREACFSLGSPENQRFFGEKEDPTLERSPPTVDETRIVVIRRGGATGIRTLDPLLAKQVL